jgi:hypothetical protein
MRMWMRRHAAPRDQICPAPPGEPDSRPSCSFCGGAEAQAAEALVLARDTLIRVTPHASSRVVKTAQPGDTYEIPGRRSGKGQPLYIMDERGELWVKVLVTETVSGFVRTDLVSVAREEYRPARGTTLLIVNLRPTADGGVSRDSGCPGRLATDAATGHHRGAASLGKPRRMVHLPGGIGAAHQGSVDGPDGGAHRAVLRRRPCPHHAGGRIQPAPP